jgi:hypothetical protein
MGTMIQPARSILRKDAPRGGGANSVVGSFLPQPKMRAAFVGVDVTPPADVRLGDQVMLLGSSDHCSVSAWKHADLENTIPYEVLCPVGHRVPRDYLV